MGRVARWLELYAEASELHEQIMPLLAGSLQASNDSGKAGSSDDQNLLQSLAHWKRILGEMDTASLGPEARELRPQIARLAQMNREIGQGTRQIRDLIAAELRQMKKSDQNLRVYKSISGQR